MRKFHPYAFVLAFTVLACSSNAAVADQTWMATGGETIIILDKANLNRVGLQFSQGSLSEQNQSPTALVLSHDAGSDVTLLTTGRSLIEISRGTYNIPDAISIATENAGMTLANLVVHVEPGSTGGSFAAVVTLHDSNVPLFTLADGKASFTNNALGRSFEVRGAAVAISSQLATQLGDEDLAGVVIGRFDARSDIEFAGGDEEPVISSEFGDDDGSPRAPSGPDVIVGGVGVSGFNGSNPNDVVGFGPSGTIRAYSVATTSCNIGTQTLNWLDCGQQSNPNCAKHPVISQNIYRLKNGRFEQLGQSWLKHGFCALSEDLCTPSCIDTNCDSLGIGCSDPYTASRNAGPGNGPKSEVNAFTGVFPYPFNLNSSGPAAISGRIQVQSDDINPSLNTGAQYWVEAQYNTQDDAAAGNADNNASHRPITFSTGFAMQFQGPTIQQIPAIRAWKVQDPNVIQTDVRVPGEGLMILSARATDNGNGTWHYEYALFNQNSDRCARSFSVPTGGAVITNIGFRDVDYHSGEPYSLTNWTSSIVSNVLTWSTETFATNPNANALRWGTMYNFRFDADIPPSPENGDITIGLFKPGTPTSVLANTVIPTPFPLKITLASPAPIDIMPACATTSFNVNIQPLGDTLAPGGALLNYSYDGGALQTLPLVPLGGTLFRVDLPPASCGATVRYFVSAQGTQGGLVYFPDTAPSVGFEPAVGTAVLNNDINEDFSGGLPAGWTATGLWNVTAACPVSPANCSAGQFAYYGQPGTCNYDNGVTNTGKLSLTVSIPSDALGAELRYCSNFERENFATSDWPSVRIGATTIDQPAQGGLGSSPWVERFVNLNAYVGQTVTIDFNFNTNDDFDNAHRGWQIDNVRVGVTRAECTAGQPGDLDANGVVDGRDIGEFTAAAMIHSALPEHVCPGDFNGDGVVSPLDAQGLADVLVNLP